MKKLINNFLQQVGSVFEILGNAYTEEHSNLHEMAVPGFLSLYFLNILNMLGSYVKPLCFTHLLILMVGCKLNGKMDFKEACRS